MGPAEEQRAEKARAEITAMITEIWGKAIGRPHVDEHSDFYWDGGNYFLAPAVVRDINKAMGLELTVHDLEQARTIAKLTDLIYFQQTQSDRSTVVPLRNIHGHRPPLFIVHGVGGNVLGFHTIAKCLDKEQPVYGIQAQALLPGREAVLRLEEMAAQYIEDMRAVSPHGPYHLLGFSFGGLVAYEIAQQLQDAGCEVGLLGMLDTRQPTYMRGSTRHVPLYTQVYWRLKLLYLRTRARNDRVRYLLRRVRARVQRVNYMYAVNKGQGKVASAVRDVEEINYVAGLTYTVRPYPGKVTLFRAEKDHPRQQPAPPDLDWGPFAGGGLEIKTLPGTHGGILYEPGLSVLAAEVTAALKAAGVTHAARTSVLKPAPQNTRRVTMEI
jgi:thioesterase domain-containing protein